MGATADASRPHFVTPPGRVYPPLRFGIRPEPGFAVEADYVPDAVGWWFTGLTDGEGCFFLSTKGHGGVIPVFIMKLRADDRAVLEKVVAELGVGLIRHVTRSGGNRQDAVQFTVGRRREIAWLTELFDAFPLQSKKARDYAIWREAAINWYAGAPGRDLAIYAEQLRAVRRYPEDAA